MDLFKGGSILAPTQNKDVGSFGEVFFCYPEGTSRNRSYGEIPLGEFLHGAFPPVMHRNGNAGFDQFGDFIGFFGGDCVSSPSHGH